MTTPEHTTPDLPAPIQRNFDDAIEQARLVAECDALAEGLMRRIDHLDAELNGLRGQLRDLGVKRTAADIEVGEYMHAVHTMCERRGITAPQLPKIELPRPEVEQPIEHQARAATTTTQRLPDDVFQVEPQPSSSPDTALASDEEHHEKSQVTA